MTTFEWTTTALGAVTAIGIPILVLLVRLTVKFTRLDSRVADLTEDMREDRLVTDRRLRWLEETLWKGRR